MNADDRVAGSGRARDEYSRLMFLAMREQRDALERRANNLADQLRWERDSHKRTMRFAAVDLVRSAKSPKSSLGSLFSGTTTASQQSVRRIGSLRAQAEAIIKRYLKDQKMSQKMSNDIHQIVAQIEQKFTAVGELMAAGEKLGYKAMVWDSANSQTWDDLSANIKVVFTLTANGDAGDA
jgi:hypothetical protein